MSHKEYIEQLRQQKTSNTFIISQYNIKKGTLENSQQLLFATFGRNKDNTYILTNSVISRYHCVLYFNGDTLILQDLDSKTGTFIGRYDPEKKICITENKLPSFGQEELKQNSCFECYENIFVIEKIEIALQQNDNEILVQQSKCIHCNKQVPVYTNEFERLQKEIQYMNEQSLQIKQLIDQQMQKAQNMMFRISMIENKMIEKNNQDIALSTIDMGETKLQETQKPQAVMFKSKAEVLGTEEKPGQQKQLKNVSEHKKTPMVKHVSFSSEEE